MTVSILQTLAMLPSEAFGPPLSFEELGKYLHENLDTLHEKERNRRHAIRDELYKDGGVQHMKSVIDTVFKDPDVKERRKQWVEHARFSNPLKRIVNELSTVYAEPAQRSVDGDEANQARYKALLERVSMDEVMLQVSRLLTLHRALLVRLRVRTVPGTDEREPVIDYATPTNVRCVLHPNDPTLVIAWCIRTSYRTARPGINTPAWTLWSDHERVQLREDFFPITESYIEHGLGVCPWVPVSLSPIGAGFWPGEEGEDLTAAAVARWFAGVLLLKETKSATTVPALSGDGATMARGQAADTETPIELADGQSVTTVDMSMDLEMFTEVSDHIMEQVAQNYGMSSGLINQQGVQSADARELMRVPLRELRLHQQVPLRRFESRFAIASAAVLRKDEPTLAFDPKGFRVAFGEAQTPLGRGEALDLFLKARSAGVDNTLAFLCRSRPGMTEEQARAELEHNIVIETERNVLMRPLQEISGSLGANSDGKPPAAPPNGDDKQSPADA